VATTPDENGDGRDEARRYRAAANDALQQLDWCIGYLHGIGKLKISRALSQNRSFIRERLMQRDAQPLPTSEVAEE
jgi:hypothetical protein